MDEKRKFVRLVWKAKVKALKGDKIRQVVSSGMLKNISKDGFGFSSEDQLQRGIIYDFQIGDIQEMPINLKGMVMRARNVDQFFQYGVHIESVALLDRIRLNQFLVARDGKIKFRFLIYSLLIGAAAGFAGHLFFGWGHGLCIVLFFVTTLLHIFFPPY